MGFVGLVKFAVKCFDILAWPLLALVYPLCASVRAIEADDSSSSECRKLVAYWVLFSLIFLFEQAFDKLLLWLPFWLYMKLIITCWLVIPNFDGALFAYKHLVCPCLSMDIKVLINKLNAWIYLSVKRDNFEDEVKRYVKENGPEALEELVASKLVVQLKSEEPNVGQKDVKTVQVTEQIKEMAASNEVKLVPHFLQEATLTRPDFTETENKKHETDLLSSEKVEAVGESSEIPLPKQVQKEWTCAICQVTTQSETTLNAHLLGKRHKNACEELKTKTHQSKNKASTAPEIKDWKDLFLKKYNLEAEVKEKRLEVCEELVSSELKCRESNIEQKDVETVEVTKREEVAVAKQQVSPIETIKNNVAAEEIKVISGRAEEAGGELSGNQVSNQVQKKWTCTLCQVTTQSEITLNSHLQGRRHKAACVELQSKNRQSKSVEDAASLLRERQKKNKLLGVRKKYVEYKEPLWWCKICNISCNSSDNMDCHLYGKKHLDQTKEFNAAAAAKKAL